jgi:hypothetical protein
MRHRRRSGLSETNPRTARLRRKIETHASRDPLHRRHEVARGVRSATGGAEPCGRNRLAVRKRKRKSKPLGRQRTKRNRANEKSQQRLGTGCGGAVASERSFWSSNPSTISSEQQLGRAFMHGRKSVPKAAPGE